MKLVFYFVPHGPQCPTRALGLRKIATSGSFYILTHLSTRLGVGETIVVSIAARPPETVGKNGENDLLTSCLRKGCVYPRARPEAPRTREHALLPNPF